MNRATPDLASGSASDAYIHGCHFDLGLYSLKSTECEYYVLSPQMRMARWYPHNPVKEIDYRLDPTSERINMLPMKPPFRACKAPA